jgi:hypothetical protein
MILWAWRAARPAAYREWLADNSVLGAYRSRVGPGVKAPCQRATAVAE